MDNITHTLVGVALGEAGLKRRTGLGMAALAIGANLPDLDVLAIPFGANLTFRRGWTHGPLAWFVLPVALCVALVTWDRWQARRGTRPIARAAVRAGPLLALAFLGVATHPFLDWLNSYGIRLLMPFSWRWFYGDSLFIVDPWVWLALGLAVFVARRRDDVVAPRVALGVVAAYIVGMIGLTSVARRAAWNASMRDDGMAPARMMAGPVPLVPWRRELVLDMGDRYRRGEFDPTATPSVRMDPGWVMRGEGPETVAAARADADVRAFLMWSRFPVFTVRDSAGYALVRVGDMRFRRRGAGAFTVETRVPRP